MSMAIDIAFDFRTDANGQDPDSHSPTLRRYHRLLWSKPLPSGASFDLSETTPGVYLHHSSSLGEFCLSSDSVMQTFTRWPALKPITEQFPSQENEDIQDDRLHDRRHDGLPREPDRWKLDHQRGPRVHPSISDRFDLTLECIRRHYLDQESPLAATLSRYADFFALFGDFRGYVSFFLLDDLVTEDLSVKFFMPFDDFRPPSVPRMSVPTRSTAAARSSSSKPGTIGSNSSTPESVLEPRRRCPARGSEVRCRRPSNFRERGRGQPPAIASARPRSDPKCQRSKHEQSKSRVFLVSHPQTRHAASLHSAL